MPIARQGGGGPIGDPVAARLSAIWTEILGVSNVGADDDFFALGGHSLNAVRMFARIRKDFGVALPLASLFQASRLGDLAALVRAEAPDVEAGATVAEAPDQTMPDMTAVHVYRTRFILGQAWPGRNAWPTAYTYPVPDT